MFESSMTGNENGVKDMTKKTEDTKAKKEKGKLKKSAKKEKTDTAFIYASPETKLSRVYAAMKKLEGSKVRNWYVFATNRPSLHNPSYAK